ncbi:MAG: NAD(P)-dependent glycerol-3-phosphate dehydrogenase [Lentisphaerae bacterium]|nr:NAD(P)-dependent glycerol-3-phosphate dehydrogenase [Lentisphaerota bacterium]
MSTPQAAIIGDGAWGTALALVLHANGHRVRVWGPFADQLEAVRAAGENAAFLPGVPLPPDIEWTADRGEAVRAAELVVLAVPTRYFRDVAAGFAGRLPAGARVVSVAKGFDPSTRRRMTEVARETLGLSRVAALSGPSHAEEVARRIPTAVTVAAADPDLAAGLQEHFNNDRFRVYTSTDVAGVELGGALKNVIAVAVGVSDGLGFGDNTRAALITRGLVEMTRLGGALGARERTFAGLSGMGDLIATCTSRLSRNRNFGERIGKGESPHAVLAASKQAVEGAWNCAIARELAREAGVEAPITGEVNAIVHAGKSPADAVAALMTRETKAEEA